MSYETPAASVGERMAFPIMDYTKVNTNKSLDSAVSAEPGQIHLVPLQGRSLLLSPGDFRQRWSGAQRGTKGDWSHLAH